ncbi:MAG: ATP-binding protein, partial [Candidatus Aminicenantales bacterium]
ELYVRMGREDKDKYDLIVRDTGVGLPKDFDLSQTKTLGFQIIRDLVKQLGGSIEIRKDKGTEIIIRF